MRKSLKWVLFSCILFIGTHASAQLSFNSITANSGKQLTQTISSTATLFITPYKLTGDYYNQTGNCPSPGTFAMLTTQLPQVSAITNVANCVVILQFQPANISASIPTQLANVTIAVAPQFTTQSDGTSTLNFNSPVIYANFFDSSLLKQAPACGTPIDAISNSSFGVQGLYAQDPVGAATKEVLSGNGCV